MRSSVEHIIPFVALVSIHDRFDFQAADAFSRLCRSLEARGIRLAGGIKTSIPEDLTRHEKAFLGQ